MVTIVYVLRRECIVYHIYYLHVYALHLTYYVYSLLVSIVILNSLDMAFPLVIKKLTEGEFVLFDLSK